jgi:hypothetical protein
MSNVLARMSKIPFLKALSKRYRLQPLIVGVLAIGVIVPLLAIGWLYGYLAYDLVMTEGKASKIQADLENEWKEISSKPGSEAVATDSGHTISVASITSEYRTRAGYKDLRAYYDAELTQHGWRFVKEENLLYDRHDYGGKQAFYCKGKFTADLFYAGQQEQQFGWKYSFSLSWGTYDYCN